ncbi:MAG: DinB family protein [Ferruginibacter sp.]
MKVIATQLEQIINDYSAKFFALAENELSFKPAAEKWSKKEIIGHLIDSAQNNIHRFVVTQYQTDPHVVYAQNDWVNVQGYADYNSKDLIILWQLLNKHIVVILNKMPAEHYMLQCNTGKDNDEFHTLEFLANDYITHHLHHLKQIVQ